MKRHSFISRLQELNDYLEEFPLGIEGQETTPLPADEIMEVLYHSMPSTWKNKMIGQGFIYANSTAKEMSHFFETRVENLEPKEEKKKSSAAAKKANKKTPRSANKKTSMPVLYSPVNILLWSTIQIGSTSSYKVNTTIL